MDQRTLKDLPAPSVESGVDPRIDYSALRRQLLIDFPSNFGGAYLNGGTLVLLERRHSAELEAEARRVLQLPTIEGQGGAGVASALEFAPATYSLNSLFDVMHTILDGWSSGELSGLKITGVGIDDRANRVDLGVDQLVTSRLRIEIASRLGPAVKVSQMGPATTN